MDNKDWVKKVVNSSHLEVKENPVMGEGIVSQIDRGVKFTHLSNKDEKSKSIGFQESYYDSELFEKALKDLVSHT